MFILITFLVTVLFIFSGVAILSLIIKKDHQSIVIFGAWTLMAGITGYIFMIAGLLNCLNTTTAVLWLITLIIISFTGRKCFGTILEFAKMNFSKSIFSSETGINIIAMIIFVYLLISFIGALAPPANLDVMNYHFAILKQCLDSNSLVFNPTFFYGATPFSAEMLSAFMTLLSDIRGGQLIQFVAGLLLVFSVYIIGRESFGARRAVLATTVFISTLFFPAILSEAKNDQMLALSSFLSLHLMANASNNSNSRSLLMGAALGGLAAGMKTYGLAIPMIGLSLILLGMVFHRNTISSRSFALSILVAALFASPWYLRSWLLTGNPVHPFFTQLFSDRYWDSTLSFKFELLREWRYIDANLIQFLLSPFRLTFDADSYLARLGPIYLSILPAIFVFRVRNPILRFHGIAALIYFVLWFVILRDARYLLPILPGVALLFAEPMRQIYEKGKWPKIIIILAITINLLMALVINFRIQYQKFPAALGIIGEEEFYRNLKEVDRRKLSDGSYVIAIPEFDFLQKVNSMARESNNIGLFSYDEPFIYYSVNAKIYLLLPLWQNSFDFQSMVTEADIGNQLDSMSIDYVITDTGDDTIVPSNELLAQFPEFGLSLRGANIFLGYLHDKCDLVVFDGKYRCFKRR